MLLKLNLNTKVDKICDHQKETCLDQHFARFSLDKNLTRTEEILQDERQEATY